MSFAKRSGRPPSSCGSNTNMKPTDGVEVSKVAPLVVRHKWSINRILLTNKANQEVAEKVSIEGKQDSNVE